MASPSFASESLVTSVLRYQQPQEDFFDNETEAQYFLVFRNKVVSKLAGVVNSDLRRQVILQVCHFESFVREAVVALAAITTPMVTIRERTTGPGRHLSLATTIPLHFNSMAKPYIV